MTRPGQSVDPEVAGPGTCVWWGGPVLHAWLGREDASRAVETVDEIEEWRRANTPGNLFELADRMARWHQSGQAELGLAIALNLPWTGGQVVKDGRHVADVGAHVEVRWTGAVRNGLILHENDKHRRRDPYVLATGWEDLIVYHGWALGGEVTRPSRHRADLRHPGYVMPAADLRPMSELRELGERGAL